MKKVIVGTAVVVTGTTLYKLYNRATIKVNNVNHAAKTLDYTVYLGFKEKKGTVNANLNEKIKAEHWGKILKIDALNSRFVQFSIQNKKGVLLNQHEVIFKSTGIVPPGDYNQNPNATVNQ